MPNRKGKGSQPSESKMNPPKARGRKPRKSPEDVNPNIEAMSGGRTGLPEQEPGPSRLSLASNVMCAPPAVKESTGAKGGKKRGRPKKIIVKEENVEAEQEEEAKGRKKRAGKPKQKVMEEKVGTEQEKEKGTKESKKRVRKSKKKVEEENAETEKQGATEGSTMCTFLTDTMEIHHILAIQLEAKRMLTQIDRIKRILTSE